MALVDTFASELVSGLTGGRPDDLLLVTIGLTVTFGIIYALGGRVCGLRHGLHDRNCVGASEGHTGQISHRLGPLGRSEKLHLH